MFQMYKTYTFEIMREFEKNKINIYIFLNNLKKNCDLNWEYKEYSRRVLHLSTRNEYLKRRILEKNT